jgi:hypothetical protein
MSVHVMSSCSTIFSQSEYAECSILVLVSGSPCGLGFGMPRFRNLCLHTGSAHCCSEPVFINLGRFRGKKFCFLTSLAHPDAYLHEDATHYDSSTM